MKRVAFIVFAVVLIAVVLNDGGRWFNARARLNESTAQVADAASAALRSSTRDAAAQSVVADAGRHGIRVTQYGQDPNGLQIWTAVDVHGTWVLGPYVAFLGGAPFDQAVAAPFVIKDYQQAQFR